MGGLEPHADWNSLFASPAQDIQGTSSIWNGGGTFYPGDTITARSTTKSARLSASNPANGIVTWLTEGFNQRDELVIDFERSNLVRLRHPPKKEAAA